MEELCGTALMSMPLTKPERRKRAFFSVGSNESFKENAVA